MKVLRPICLPFEVPFNPTYGLNPALFKTEILLVGVAAAVEAALMTHAVAHTIVPRTCVAATPEIAQATRNTLAAWQIVFQVPVGHARRVMEATHQLAVLLLEIAVPLAIYVVEIGYKVGVIAQPHLPHTALVGV